MSEVTRILNQIEQGDPSAADELLPLVYEELRKLAKQRLGKEKPGQTLQATALVHEAYLRLVGKGNDDQHWDSRGHFFGAAAEAIRRILVETARRKQKVKHGGELRRIPMTEQLAAKPDDDLVALDDALTQLEEEDALASQVTNLRYFAGLGHEDVAATLHITVYQARQKWTYARAWLRNALGTGR